MLSSAVGKYPLRRRSRAAGSALAAVLIFQIRNRRELAASLLISLFCHGLLFSIFILWPRKAPQENIFNETIYKVDLVQLKPVFRPSPPPPSTPPSPPEKALPAPDKPKLAKTPAAAPEETPTRKESERHLASALEQLRHKIARKDAEKEVGQAILNLRFRQYYQQLQEKVRAGWIVPDEIVGHRKYLEVTVGITIKRDGHLLDIKIEESSGNSYFDQSVLRAVKKADPLPRLPDEYQGDTYEVGFHFNNIE